jgi:hypothetical protein
VPSCVDDESVVVVVVDVEGDVVVELLDEFIDEESVVVDDDGVVVVAPDGVDIEDESVVVEDDGVVVVDDGDDVTSPVDVACEPSFETRM